MLESLFFSALDLAFSGALLASPPLPAKVPLLRHPQ
jgi:hypothetical protein